MHFKTGGGLGEGAVHTDEQADGSLDMCMEAPNHPSQSVGNCQVMGHVLPPLSVASVVFVSVR